MVTISSIKTFLRSVRTVARYRAWQSVNACSKTPLKYLFPLMSYIYTLLSSRYKHSVLSPIGGKWRWRPVGTGRDWYFPTLSNNAKVRKRGIVAKVAAGEPLSDSMLHRYFQSDVEIETGDVVFDVGAYIGAFSLLVSDKADRVYSFEADPDNYHCLVKNTNDKNNIIPLNFAVWKENERITLNVGNDRSDSTVLDVDGQKTYSIVARRLDALAKDVGVTTIDFLKMDVEGAEIEALEGIGELRPHKISVDTGERYSGDSADRVVAFLKTRGYRVSTDRHMIYAKMK